MKSSSTFFALSRSPSSQSKSASRSLAVPSAAVPGNPSMMFLKSPGSLAETRASPAFSSWTSFRPEATIRAPVPITAKPTKRSSFFPLASRNRSAAEGPCSISPRGEVGPDSSARPGAEGDPVSSDFCLAAIVQRSRVPSA